MFKLLLILVYLVTQIDHIYCCTCMLTHAQQHFCSADFVILADVQRIMVQDGDMNGYSVKYKKIFKMTAEARNVLSSDLIWSSSMNSLCGVNFNYNVRYLVTGRVYQGKAIVNLCNFVEEWANLSIKQRKGFRQFYAKGCGCKIRNMSDQYYQYLTKQDTKISRSSNYCFWETKNSATDCQGLFSMCAPVIRQSSETNYNNNVPVLDSNYRAPLPLRQCQWIENDRYLQCMAQRDTKYSQVEREDEP